jgi:soluble cytochrome b562
MRCFANNESGYNPPMKTMLALLVLVISASAAHATTFKEFNAKPKADQSAFVADFIDKMTTDLRAKNPDLAVRIRDWFAVKTEGKPVSEGMEQLYIELGAIELQVKEGKVDPAKVQVESVIVWVTKQKFQPQAAQK